MKKLFVHQPVFRLLSPLLSGVIVYLLILLINDNLEQIENDFFNQELNFCIGLSYLIQEFSRLLLLLFDRWIIFNKMIFQLSIQICLSILFCILFTSFSINLYFKYIIGFEINFDELMVFNIIFCTLNVIYVFLNISHQYLYKTNTKKIAEEKAFMLEIKDEFHQFKSGINPGLLFESLEHLIVLLKVNKEASDDFLDNLASIYRYILSKKDKQLVAVNEELVVIHYLVDLLNSLPYSSLRIENRLKHNFMIVPSALIHIIEQVVKKSIISSNLELELHLEEMDNTIILKYHKLDKINSKFTIDDIFQIRTTYKFYTDIDINVYEKDDSRYITLPKLEIQSKI